MLTWICSIASMLIGCELVCPPRVEESPNALLKLAPSTVTLLYKLLRPPKLKPLDEGVSLVKSCKLLLMVGNLSICERLITSWLPVRLELKTLSWRVATTTSCSCDDWLVSLKSALYSWPRIKVMLPWFSDL